MKKFRIVITETTDYELTVDAVTEEEACDLAHIAYYNDQIKDIDRYHRISRIEVVE